MKDFRFIRKERFSCGKHKNTVKIYEHERTGLDFVLIPGGKFQMGSNRGRESEEPAHKVKIKPFLLCRTSVTEGAWKRIYPDSPGWMLNKEYPIDGISYSKAKDFCKKTGLRLPSEAEWEYACRGKTRARYFFGDSSKKLYLYAWYRRNDIDFIVGQKLSNMFGLYDMLGSVREWCQDVWHDNYLGAPTDGSAWEDVDSLYCVCRGGYYGSAAFDCRPTHRDRAYLLNPETGVGFRPAANVEES